MKVDFAEADYRDHKQGEPYAGHIVLVMPRNFETHNSFQFTLELEEDAKKEDPTCLAFTSQLLTPKSKLFKWATAVLGEDFDKDDFDTTQLEGMPITVVFEHSKDDDGTWRERVATMMGREAPKLTQDELAAKDEEAPF